MKIRKSGVIYIAVLAFMALTVPVQAETSRSPSGAADHRGSIAR